MKKLHIKEARILPSIESLETFEKEKGIKLPKTYKQFLSQQNPYTVNEDLYNKDGKEFEIHHFYPFDSSFELSLQYVFGNLNDFFESKYIAFADDSGGWQYVINLQEKDYGKVYFCRMDEELPNALTLLTNSFDEFINALVINKNNLF